MAEFLIKARDPIDLPDNKIKRDNGWKRGDIVVVMPDGHEWGKEEREPKFVVLKVPGMPLKDALKYIETYKVDTGLVSADSVPIYKNVAQRKYQVLLDSVSTTVKESKGSMSWENVKAYIKNKETLVTE